jgi:hypothetical protein
VRKLRRWRAITISISQSFAWTGSDISQLDINVERLAIFWHPSINHISQLCEDVERLAIAGIHQ